MLRKCFQNDPNERPDFKEIRDNIQFTLDSMLKEVLQHRLNNEKAERKLYSLPINNPKDNTMRSRYTVIKKTNKLSSNCNLNLNGVTIEESSSSLLHVSLDQVTHYAQGVGASNVLQDNCNDQNLEDNDT